VISGRLTRAASVAAVVATMAVASGGCGGDDAAPEVKPASVPEDLVPPAVQDNRFAFYESQLPQVKQSFADAGDDSLAADGELWELRKGDRLVGSLQLTTLMPEVDLADEDHRNAILSQLLPTNRDQFLVDEVRVWSTSSNNKTIYLWFGRDLYALMTLKGGSEDELDPERVLGEVVAYNVASDDWKPLYIDDELEI
jgi:hypothetical protein